MTCRDLNDALPDLVARELPPGREDDIEQHLRICPPCAALVESYRITVGLTRQLPAVPMSPVCKARLRSALAPYLSPE
jgi:anti-sigma factor RsiW